MTDDQVSEQAVIEVLETQDSLSVIEIADTLNAHPVAVDLCCYDLQEDGLVRQYISGVYTLTEDAACRLEGE